MSRALCSSEDEDLTIEGRRRRISVKAMRGRGKIRIVNELSEIGSNLRLETDWQRSESFDCILFLFCLDIVF